MNIVLFRTPSELYKTITPSVFIIYLLFVQSSISFMFIYYKLEQSGLANLYIGLRNKLLLC